MEEEKRLEELKKNKRKKKEAGKRLVRDRNRRAKVNIETDTERRLWGEHSHHKIRIRRLSREIRANNPTRCPR
jgi:hypothetical protein